MAPHTVENTYTSAGPALNAKAATPVVTVGADRRDKIVIRNAGSDDAQSIADIGSQVFALSFGHSLSVRDLETYLQEAYSLSAISEELASPLKHFAVACNEQGAVVGFAQLTQGTSEPCVADAEKPIELQRLYIHQDYHGLGVGKRLIQQVEDIARTQGFKTMWLGVWEENYKAQKVYERSGYVKVGYHDFKMGDCIQTDFVMSKRL